MYSLPSRSQRRQPFAFFIAIGYGSKYFTSAVTPPGRERRARFAYPRDAFVLAARSVPGSAFAMSRGYSGPDRYSLRECRGPVDLLTLNTHPAMRARAAKGLRWAVEISKNHTRPARRHGTPGSRARNWSVSLTPDCCPGKRSSRLDVGPARTQSHLHVADIG